MTILETPNDPVSASVIVREEIVSVQILLLFSSINAHGSIALVSFAVRDTVLKVICPALVVASHGVFRCPVTQDGMKIALLTVWRPLP